MKNKIVLLGFVLILLFILASLTYAYSQPNMIWEDTFDSTANWTMSNASMSDGMLCQNGGVSTINNPTRIIYNLSRNTINQTHRIDFVSNGTSTLTGDIAGLLLTRNVSSAMAGKDLFIRMYGNTSNNSFMVNDGNELQTPIKMMNQGNGWQRVSIVINTSDTRAYFFINNIYQGSLNVSNNVGSSPQNWSYFSMISQGASTWCMDNLSISNGSGLQTRITINTFLEGTSTLITPNTLSYQFNGIVNYFNATTTTGTFIIPQNIPPDTYNLRITSTGFTTRNYNFILSPYSNFVLPTYLTNSSLQSLIQFTYQDANTILSLPNVTVNTSERIGNDYYTLDYSQTDIAGGLLMYLDTSKTYRITASLAGYQTKTFDLNPTSNTYNIPLESLVTLDYSTLFNAVNFVTYPRNTSIQNAENTNFSIVTSMIGTYTMQHFGLNTTLNSNLFLVNSTSSSGGTASFLLNLSNFSNRRITVTYFMNINGKYPFYQDITFFISNLTPTNYTLQYLGERAKRDLTEREAVLLATIITLLFLMSMYSIGVRGKKLNWIACVPIGIFMYFGFWSATESRNALIGGVMIFLLVGSAVAGIGIGEDE